MPSSTDLLTMKDAADLCDVSRDTIKRDLRDGKYPNAIQSGGPGGPWLIPVGDLVAAGRHTPTSDEDALEVVRARRADRDLTLLRERLAAAEARAERAEDEVTYLRRLLDRKAA